MLNSLRQAFVQFPSYPVNIGVDGQVPARRGDDSLPRRQSFLGQRQRGRNRNRKITRQIDGDGNLLDTGQRDTPGESARAALETAHRMPGKYVVEVFLWDTERESRGSGCDGTHIILLAYEK